jgi:DNA-binding transcriptional LysR family regulator
MRDDDWILLKTLDRLKSVSKVAKELYITQPALSKRLSRIEREFGVAVATRSSRGVTLTAEGEYLARTADKILGLVAEAKQHIATPKSNVLLIGTSNTFARFSLLNLIREYNVIHKDAMIFVTSAVSDQVLRLVEDRTVQLGFVRGEHDHNMEEFVYSQDQGWIVTNREVGMDELSAMPLIQHSRDNYTIHFTSKWWDEHFLHPLVIGMKVNDVGITQEMVRSGLGFGVLFDDYISGCEGLVKMRMLTRDGRPMMRKTSMIYCTESLRLRHVRQFVDFIRNGRRAKRAAGRRQNSLTSKFRQGGR